MSLEEFKRSCIDCNPDEVVDRYLIERPSYFFEKIGDGHEYEFKKEIAQLLSVHIRDIVIVGSGKLGFSLKPDNSHPGLYPFTPFDGRTSKKSDLDLAIVSSSLFDRELQNLYDHIVVAKEKWVNSARESFSSFILKGRLTIRNLPGEFQFTKDVRSVQGKYRMKYSRDINLEIYKSWHYFETYHQRNVLNIHINLIAST